LPDLSRDLSPGVAAGAVPGVLTLEPRRPPLDPRSVLAALVVVNVVSFTAGFAGGGSAARLICLIVPALVAVTAGRMMAAVVYGLVVAVVFAAEASFLAGAVTPASFLISGATGLAARLLPPAFMAYAAVASIGVSSLLAALARWRVPQFVAIPSAVVLRFAPTVFHENAAVAQAMRVRGVSIGRVGLMTWFEYRLIPLLICSVKCGEELSQAALTRGLGGPGGRTHLGRIGFGPLDGVLWILLAGAIGLWAGWRT
jgi:energy-coupling factor transport system permease protein